MCHSQRILALHSLIRYTFLRRVTLTAKENASSVLVVFLSTIVPTCWLFPNVSLMVSLISLLSLMIP